MKYKKVIKEMIKRIPAIMPDLLAAGGAVSVSVGCFKISEPAGFIAMGLFLVTGAVILSKA